MRNFIKFIAALAVLAGVVFFVLELMKRRDEDEKRKSDRALRNLVKMQRSKREGEIADYRFDDDDEFYDEVVEDGDAYDSAGEDVSFDLSEDALEQLLDS